MKVITATDASRSFADLLDAVAHKGESFVIMRRGVAVAELGEVRDSFGATLDDLFALFESLPPTDRSF